MVYNGHIIVQPKIVKEATCTSDLGCPTMTVSKSLSRYRHGVVPCGFLGSQSGTHRISALVHFMVDHPETVG